jgi:ABC-type sugar transport system ATPase subunit
VTFLEVRGLTKRFQGVLALNAVDFGGEAGEVHALVGANGAGKSTFMNVLAGAIPPSSGEIFLDGQRLTIRSPHEAWRIGISTVYQETSLIPELTVAENLFLGREPASRIGRIDRIAITAAARRVLEYNGIYLNPAAPAGGLSIAQRQLAEIARALASSPRVLILDEPTAMLAGAEVEHLFDIVRRLKSRGVLVLYVSHRLEEVFSIADRITVLRDGQTVATVLSSEVSPRQLVMMMIGRDITEGLDLAAPTIAAAPRLSVSWGGPSQPSHLAVQPGEIVGLVGMVGSGRTDLALRLAGIRSAPKVRVEMDGRTVSINSPRQADANGIVYLTEDRKRDGLFLPLSIVANTTAAALSLFSKAGMINGRTERDAAREVLARLQTVYHSLDRSARELSGGNQQKLLFGRALLRSPRLLICDEPTRGIDVGAKREIYRILTQLAGSGIGTILISSEIGELQATCHRLVVIRSGRAVAEARSSDLREEELLSIASGVQLE